MSIKPLRPGETVEAYHTASPRVNIADCVILDM